MTGSTDLWILGGLCLGLGLLYSWANRVRKFRVSEISALSKALERVSTDLQHSEKEREQLLASKSELLALVCHEVRTPLTCLVGYTQMMLDKEYPRDTQVDYLTVVLKETQNLNQLLTDLLDARAQTVTNDTKLHPGNLEDLLRETFALFRNQPGPHRIVLDVAGPLPKVNIDPQRIRQVLSNLLSNAVKYSPAGGTIRLNAFVRANHVVCCIREEGIGIPADAIPKLFTRFFRVRNDHTSDIPGTGLGLALVRECIQAHRGDTWVESRPGRGSSFYFSLPVIRSQEMRTTSGACSPVNAT